MPRKSDTADRVLEVADRLLEQGIRPTQQNVREQLGTGSISTINRALNEWWQQLGVRLREGRERPELPEPVVETANKLWQQALGYADHAYAERKAELDARYREVKEQARLVEEGAVTELREIQQQNVRLLAEREQSADERQKLQQQMLALESDLIRLNAENGNLKREIKQQALMLDRQQGSGGATDTQELIELKVSLRLSEEERARLEASQEALADENAVLRKQLLLQEKEAVSKRHALETVIAQQDVRYDQLLKELDECQRKLAEVLGS
ncbi:DNA-binding protein [Pontibacterium granulatum]|uniref:DNA-binding protein n=1 Tax=Pontibacterium granulatum TaxID=2036029 RepID=UPI00249A3A21|nr:DNA-binding protein [Pontibacterium granulatum]MDI3325838.1 DNA-binding protein [Pontibacterium granulatum]